MKYVLIVSATPYSPSNRGIDILTYSFFCSNYVVHHLCYPYNKIAAQVTESIPGKRFKQFVSKKSRLIYYEDFMYWLPKIFTKFFVWFTNKTLPSDINFSQYDNIVIESGKPIFLIKKLKNFNNIIYRQSDSVRLIWSKNKYLWDLEDRIIERANRIIVINDSFYNLISSKYQSKTTIIKNGYTIPEVYDDSNPYNSVNNCIYFGLFTLDYHTIAYLSQCFPEYNFHIIGRGLTKREIKKLSQLNNVKFYGVKKPYDYIRYIKYADIAFVPFNQVAKFKHFGITSKYLLFMYFKLPVISYRLPSVTKDHGIKFVDDKEQFVEQLRLHIGQKKEYDNWLDSLTREQIINEYQKFIRLL